MAGIERDTPIPTDIKLHKKSRILELCYEDGERFELGYEFLRVFTPSAEARGHGPGQEVLQTGKRNVEIERIEACRNLCRATCLFRRPRQRPLLLGSAVQPRPHHDELWREYLKQIEAQGASRDIDTTFAPQ